MTSLGEQIKTAVKQSNVLMLNNLHLRTLPKEVCESTNLTNLIIDGNELTTLPPDIKKLTNLVALSVKSNRLAFLPPEIGALTNLKYLELNSNHLTDLPFELTYLENLKELEIGNNMELPTDYFTHKELGIKDLFKHLIEVEEEREKHPEKVFSERKRRASLGWGPVSPAEKKLLTESGAKVIIRPKEEDSESEDEVEKDDKKANWGLGSIVTKVGGWFGSQKTPQEEKSEEVKEEKIEEKAEEEEEKEEEDEEEEEKVEEEE